MFDRSPISFKDPDGFVIKKHDGYYRIIANSYKNEYDHFMHSGLYQELVKKKLLITHTESNLLNSEPNLNTYKELFPQQIDCFIYPYEWGFSQWKQMINTFLRINIIALKYGMILKDSSPFNFTFINHRCLMIDTSSFDFFEEPSSWNAYLQFCEEILSPFALMHFNSSIWGRLTQSYLTGLPLEFVSKELSWRSHFNLTCLMHIHWHAKFKYKKEKEISNSKITKKGFSKEQLKNLWEQIFTNIQSWDNKELKNRNWDEYYDHQIESILYLEEKEKVISEWLLELKPEITIDLGANTGKFSFIAAKYSKNVFALESDIICVDQIFEKTRKLPSNNITVIAADIVEPSPALGWANAEKPALSKRLKGDMLLSLALIHHLSIGRNVPLNFIAAEFSNITSNYAIVEFIPKTDKQLKSLLESKEDIYYNYSEEFFTETFLKYFKLIKVYSFQDSARKLFLWQK